jgi:hypothetical protein
VSVSGTGSGASQTVPLFLGSVASADLRHRLSGYDGTDLPIPSHYYLAPAFHSGPGLASCVTTRSPPRWRGNVDPLPIGYAFRPRLRVPANRRLIFIAAETLGFRRTGFSPVFAPTHAGILTSQRSTVPRGFGFSALGTLPYRHTAPEDCVTRGFGTGLKPRKSFGASPLDRSAVTHCLKDGCL